MNIKLEIKLYFLTRNYDTLKNLIVFNDEVIIYFTKKQIEKLLAYAKDNKEMILAIKLLNDIVTNNYQKFSEMQIDDYLNQFLVLAYTNPIYLCNYANMLTNSSIKYSLIIDKIKEYNLNHEITEITLYMLYLDDFYDERLVNKIVETKNTHYIFELIREANSLNTKSIFQKYLKTNPSAFDIYCLSKNLMDYNDKLEILINIILRLNINNLLKSKYLLSTYKSINRVLLKEKLIMALINLNSLLPIFDLMQLLSSEEQEKISNKYLNEKEDEKIFTLACTTNCNKTKDLIDYAFPSLDFYKLTVLITYVNEKYIGYILKKIIMEKKSLYLKVLNELYLIGSNRFINMIDYIVAYKLENLFDIKIIKRLISAKENEKTRYLTY